MPGIGQSSCTEPIFNDPATATLGDHLLGCDLGPEKGALQVDLHDLFVLGFSCVENRRPGLDASIVDHDVEPAQLFHGPVDQHLEVRNLTHVGIDTDRPVTKGGDLLFEIFGRLFIGNVVDSYVGPGAGQSKGYCLSDAGVATGYDGDLSFKRYRPLLFFRVECCALAATGALTRRIISRLSGPMPTRCGGFGQGANQR